MSSGFCHGQSFATKNFCVVVLLSTATSVFCKRKVDHPHIWGTLPVCYLVICSNWRTSSCVSSSQWSFGAPARMPVSLFHSQRLLYLLGTKTTEPLWKSTSSIFRVL